MIYPELPFLNFWLILGQSQKGAKTSLEHLLQNEQAITVDHLLHIQ